MKPKDVLQELLDRTGENPNSLAKKTGVAQSTIQRLLANDTKEPRRSTLEPIAKYYGFPVDAFFQGPGAPILRKPDDAAHEPGVHRLPEDQGNVIAWEHPDDLLPDENRVWIDRYDYQLSAGTGIIQWEIRSKQALPFDMSFFRALRSKPKDCKLLLVRGDSMEPYLFNRDLAMVDSSKTTIRDGKIYAVHFEDEPLVKQIFKQAGGGVTLHSYNVKYPDRTISADQMESLSIVGEVIYRSGSGPAGGN